MHKPLPVIVEHAVISRGQNFEDTQDELVGFAFFERDAAALANVASIESVGLVKAPPRAFFIHPERKSEINEHFEAYAGRANNYWFVSMRDEEIACAQIDIAPTTAAAAGPAAATAVPAVPIIAAPPNHRKVA